jgi:hypothetical protein
MPEGEATFAVLTTDDGEDRECGIFLSYEEAEVALHT